MNNISPQMFQNFMETMKGRNPDQMLNEILNSGKINQQQLNYVQGIAKNLESQFINFKSMFNLK